MPAGDVGRAVRDALGRDLLAARKARDAARTSVLRTLLSTIDNAEAVDAEQRFDPSLPGLGATEVPRRTLDAATVRALFAAELAERRQAAAVYREASRPELALRHETEAEVIAAYLDALPGQVGT